ncbi:SDR family oxidoreductase [Variovorax sp. EL159]|uniref:SDR family oxidoreductase n=1 Tax=Variovorax sp. EL159 TaxID=1566270 RepID=UPI00088F588D|nr:SDR family oxidoreductase [Variovorax sp. EL159]SCX71020.1 NAD(P)-dependent dehydrogenase, short-chain alcohol dehydrogenase family [Variovorax sp. EL159]
MTIASSAFPLQNQRVVLLGGTSGIGLATAKAALAAGASVVVVSSRSQRVAEALAVLGERAEGHAVDLADEAAVRGLFERLGSFDHLVYSAGESLQIGLLAETGIDAIRKAFDVRVFGAIAAVKHAAPHLRPGGSVVLTSGVASLRPQKGWTAGASICGAMEAFTRALAVELAPIRVNLVSPGFVRTPLWAGIPEAQREAMYAERGAALPVGRVGEPEDIAQTYLYLMTNRYATGQAVVVDGGGVLV